MATAVLGVLPAAGAEQARPARFSYGPHDGGVPVERTDPSRYRQCPNPGAGEPVGTATPEEVGLDTRALQALADFHSERFQETLFVLRFGCLVHTGNLNPAFATQVKHQWSIAKPVSTTVLGLAVTQGFLSVDDPAGKYLPQLDDAHGQVTVRQLLTHTQGTHVNWTREYQHLFNPDRVAEFNRLAFDHEPGTYFEYSQTGPAVLNAIVERAVGRDFQDYAQDELFGPLGIDRDHWFWTRDAAGWTEGYAHLHMRPVDLVRIGQFWLQGMRWRGRQLVDPGFVADAVTGTDANPAFGYQFWLNHAPRHVTAGLPKREEEHRPLIASAPQDLYYSWGVRGRHQFMMPALSMVAVSTPVDHDLNTDPTDLHTYAQGEQLEGYHEFFRLLMRAVADQAVADPGPWRQPANTVQENSSSETWVEPDQTLDSRAGADNTDTRGAVMAGEDYLRVATDPDAGPFVPTH